MKALIIDDSQISRRVVRHVLKTRNIASVEAENGLHALQILTSDDEFALALVDICMPGMGGLEFVKEVRSNPKYNNLKLLMLTASDMPENRSLSSALGADDFITKPINAKLFSDKLKLHGIN